MYGVRTNVAHTERVREIGALGYPYADAPGPTNPMQRHRWHYWKRATTERSNTWVGLPDFETWPYETQRLCMSDHPGNRARFYIIAFLLHNGHDPRHIVSTMQHVPGWAFDAEATKHIKYLRHNWMAFGITVWDMVAKRYITYARPQYATRVLRDMVQPTREHRIHNMVRRAVHDLEEMRPTRQGNDYDWWDAAEQAEEDASFEEAYENARLHYP